MRVEDLLVRREEKERREREGEENDFDRLRVKPIDNCLRLTRKRNIVRLLPTAKFDIETDKLSLIFDAVKTTSTTKRRGRERAAEFCQVKE